MAATLLSRARLLASPVSLAREKTLPILEALQPLFAEGTLRRGTAVSIAVGHGATSLAVALSVAASATGSWVAIVGDPTVRGVSLIELGLHSERMVLVTPELASSWPVAVATLVDGFVLARRGGHIDRWLRDDRFGPTPADGGAGASSDGSDARTGNRGGGRWWRRRRV